MRIYSTFPFSEAIFKQVGDFVAVGGVPRRIVEKVRTGRNEPYFRLEGMPDDHWLCQDGPGLFSWQCVGDAR